MGYAAEVPLSELSILPSGELGTDVTVSRMGDLARLGTRSPDVRATAESIVRQLPARNWPAETRAVEEWIRKRLRFTRDGVRVETLKTPERMIGEINEHGLFIGDCDDAATLGAALLMSVGHPVAFQTLGRGGKPHHVNVLDRLSGLTVDPTGEPRGFFGYRKLYEV